MVKAGSATLVALLSAAAEVPPIDPRTGDKNFKPKDGAVECRDLVVLDGVCRKPAAVLKRPAAVEPAVVVPAAVAPMLLMRPAAARPLAKKSSRKKLVYSQVYHREKTRQAKLGKSPDECKTQARQCAQSAVADL